jgi:CRP-like cAMP-binding protein
MDVSSSEQHSNTTERLLDDALKELNVLELLDCNSALRKLSAVQKRHLESLAEGPISYQPGERLWRAGCPVDKAFIIVQGSASFVPRRRNAGSATAVASLVKDGEGERSNGIGATMQKDANIAMKELGRQVETDGVSQSSSDDNSHKFGSALPLEKFFNRDGTADQSNQDFEELKRGLAKRHTLLNSDGSVASGEFSLAGTDSQGEHSLDSEIDAFGERYDLTAKHRRSVKRRRSSKARKANKVLGRLYNRRAFTGGLVFSRGHFLGDVSKMVAGMIPTDSGFIDADDGPAYGFGDQLEGAEDAFAGMVIPEEGEQQATHTSTLTAGKDGCVVLVFSKASLGPFLDEYPGLLLSLLGTQVVV